MDFVSGELLEIVSSEANELMRDPLAIQVVLEILLNGKGLGPFGLN